MKSRLFMLLVIALTALMLVAAGCGDDEETGGGGGGGTTTEESGGGEGGGSTGNAQADEAVKAAVESCKSSVTAVPNLSADTKSDLEDICDKAASGDAKAVQEATKEVCEKIVEDTVPEGAARDQALQACAAAGGG